MSRYWSEFVHQLEPYIPGEQPKITDLVKLNTNENPYGPSPRVIEAIQRHSNDQLRLYPDPTSSELCQAIADYYQLDKAQVFVGNGSDEVLGHVFNAFFRQPQPLLCPDISYSFYPVYCQLYGIDYQTVPLADDFSIDLNAYLQPNGGVIFPNPNAPTGCLLSLAEIEKFLQQQPDTLAVIDEAYIDFGGESAVSLIARYPNLLVVQTLSKSRSLAGMRVGFALAQAELIEALVRVKDSFNSYPIDRLASVAGIAAMQDQSYFEQTCQQVIASRDAVTVALQQLGFEVLPSAANFVFTRHPQHDAAELAAQLREQKVIVRYFNKPRIDQFLRISIGTDAENQQLLQALNTVLSR